MASLDESIAAFGRLDPASAGIFCDFDGTLSQIVDDPADAAPVAGASDALAALARHYAVVAIVSARGARDLAGRIAPAGVRIFGLHGLEEMRDFELVVSPQAESFRAAVEEAAVQCEDAFSAMPGMFVERKGLAVAVHARRAADPEWAFDAASPIVARIAQGCGLVAHPGRMVLEVRPPLGAGKADVVLDLCREANVNAVLVAGDDVGDLPAFGAARMLGHSLCIGIASSEAPNGFTDAIDVLAVGPKELVRALERLADV